VTTVIDTPTLEAVTTAILEMRLQAQRTRKTDRLPVLVITNGLGEHRLRGDLGYVRAMHDVGVYLPKPNERIAGCLHLIDYHQTEPCRVVDDAEAAGWLRDARTRDLVADHVPDMVEHDMRRERAKVMA
jgi:hypothetical protein